MTIEEIKKENKSLKEEISRLRFLVNDLQEQVRYYKDALLKLSVEESKDVVSDETHELAVKLMKDVRDLSLSVRALSILKSADCEKIVDVLRLHKEDLLTFRNCGKKTIDEISNALAQYGLEWGMDVDKIIKAFRKEVD
jgi:DNA-directed RNA polymerase subunit alpha